VGNARLPSFPLSVGRLWGERGETPCQRLVGGTDQARCGRPDHLVGLLSIRLDVRPRSARRELDTRATYEPGLAFVDGRAHGQAGRLFVGRARWRLPRGQNGGDCPTSRMGSAVQQRGVAHVSRSPRDGRRSRRCQPTSAAQRGPNAASTVPSQTTRGRNQHLRKHAAQRSALGRGPSVRRREVRGSPRRRPSSTSRSRPVKGRHQPRSPTLATGGPARRQASLAGVTSKPTRATGGRRAAANAARSLRRIRQLRWTARSRHEPGRARVLAWRDVGVAGAQRRTVCVTARYAEQNPGDAHERSELRRGAPSGECCDLPSFPRRHASRD